MIHSKLIIATLAGAVLYFLLGWVLYGILLMDFFTNNSIQYEGLMKEMPDLIFMFLSNLVMAFFLAFILDHWANKKSFAKGFTAGLFITFLIGLSFDLMFYSSMNIYTPVALVVDVIVVSVMGGITGGVIGWILGSGKKAEA